MSEPKRLLVPVLLVVGGIAIGVGGMALFNRGPSGAPGWASAPGRIGDAAPATPGAPTKSAPSPDWETRDPLSIVGEAIQISDRDRRLEMLRHAAAALVEKDIKLALETGAKIPDANDKLEFMRALFAAW